MVLIYLFFQLSSHGFSRFSSLPTSLAIGLLLLDLVSSCESLKILAGTSLMWDNFLCFPYSRVEGLSSVLYIKWYLSYIVIISLFISLYWTVSSLITKSVSFVWWPQNLPWHLWGECDDHYTAETRQGAMAFECIMHMITLCEMS